MYPTDWQGDPKLSGCSLAARGLWWEMLLIMNDADPFGHLSLNRTVIRTNVLARLVKADMPEVEALLGELEGAGIFSRTDEGVIFSRRMLRDQARREINGTNGRRGGNPKLKKSDNRNEKSRLTEPDKQKTVQVQDSISEGGKERAGGKVIPLPFTSEAFALAWAAFEQVRVKKKKPMTDYARAQIIGDLRKMSEPDAIAALNASIRAGWTDVYPPKGSATNDNATRRDLKTTW